MRILISRLSDGTRGGAEVSAFDQAKVLHSLGHQVIYISNMPDLKAKADEIGIKTATLPWIQIGRAPLRYILFWLLLPYFMLKALLFVWMYRPNIINPHSREDQISFTLTKPLHRRPVIWKDAGDLRHQIKLRRTNVLASLYENILKLAIKKADYIYLLNEGDVTYLNDVIGKGISKKLTNIPSSILYSDYDTSATPQKKPKDKIVVGYAGRVSKIKGLQYLIEAVKILDRDDVEYWIYGDGDYKKVIKELSQGLTGVKFFKFSHNIPSYLNTFDIFVQPAEREGWGRSIKEAMYFGLPVAGSNSGGIAEQIDDGVTGLLFEPKNPEDIASKLKVLIDNPSLRLKLSRAAKAKALSDGDFTTIVQNNILPIYDSFISQDVK